jgi:hypothetical protein
MTEHEDGKPLPDDGESDPGTELIPDPPEESAVQCCGEPRNHPPEHDFAAYSESDPDVS